MVVSLGHSSSDHQTAIKAIEAGASMSTRTFNAMGAFHHREPGLIGAILTREDVIADIIADGVHLHPTTIRIIYACKGATGIAMTTDSMAVTGFGDGSYKLGELEVIVKNGAVRTSSEILAGSALTFDQALRKLAKEFGIPMREAIIMATDTPARAIGLKNRGRISEGYYADIVILDKDLNIKATYINDNLIYRSLS